MNLIQQLQSAPKWKEFEDWYSKQEFYLPFYDFGVFDNGFVRYEFEFQKGVFEKFIEQKFEIHFDGSYTLYHKHIWEYVIDNDKLLRCTTFEELLIWYFNN